MLKRLKPQIKIKTIFFLFFYLITFTLSALASSGFDKADQTLNNIPGDLKTWVPWVLKDQPEIKCPILYNNNQHLCAYSGPMNMSLDEKGGEFLHQWTVYAKSLVPLPGDMTNWPESIMVDEQSLPILSMKGKPFVQLQKGRHTIKGHFYWQQQPKYLSIPDETGLINLSIDNKAIDFPDFRNGKLWLKTLTEATHQNNRFDVRVFRKVTDSIPLKIETLIKLDVSGQQREVSLNGALLTGFIPSSVNSRLPVKIDNNGRLNIQIRPGQWEINVTSFYPNEIHSLPLTTFESPWPKNEIWVLDQQPHLRRIEVTGKNSIDANQTQLPKLWRKYPAFQMKNGELMAFNVVKRGNPDPEPDKLSLNKRIWLDFDGRGFTVNDKITGKLSRQWRLNVAPEISLGQVTLNGAPQYITQGVEEKSFQGVEVRHGKLNLSADSRIETQSRTLLSSGWDIDFNQVRATLYLPAGWQLFSLSGADASNTWIKNWTLLDLFLVLITSIAVFKLWSIRWGVIALSALVLTWHQFDAPQFIWINLIIAVALVRVLPPEGRMHKLINNYRFAVMIVLSLLILPFIVNQARTALYPQLEFGNAGTRLYADLESSGLESDDESPGTLPQKARRMASYASNNSVSKEKSYSGRTISKVQMDVVDPDAMIQTGPGLPSWTLNQYHINWDGPVRSSQDFSMILISPAMNSMLNVLRILFVLLLAWRLMDVSQMTAHIKKTSHSTLSLIMPFVTGLLLVSFCLIPMQQVEASFPTPELLEELRKESTKPAECLPQCADIESIKIELSAQTLSLKLIVHAQNDVSIPLPVPIKQWMPNEILIDEQVASGTFRQKFQQDSSVLWLFLTKGTHSVEVNGRVDYLSQLQISFPLKPHHIRLTVDGWSAEGIDQDVTKISALSFQKSRNTRVNSSDVEPSEIPVFAEMTRTFNLGQSWQVDTHIRGVWGSSYPVILRIPLMPGESVLSDNVKVEKNHAVITLNHKNSSIQWRSKLTVARQIKLKAITSTQIIEQWVLNTSPIWHVEYKGIPVVYHQNASSQGIWQPRWQPWAGEEVILDVTRPKGVRGKTITIDSSVLTITPGEQNTASNLAFNLRSSLGGQHRIHLPENAILQSVSINNKNMPIRNTADGLSLPVLPGQQKINVVWHEPRGISAIFHSSKVDLGSDSVNNEITLVPGSKRWVLMTSGPQMGPAVLFWGVFFIILIFSFALGRIKGTPLNTLQWGLLWIGLSASEPLSAIVIVACIFALRARNTMNVSEITAIKFNAFQVVLILLVSLSVIALIASIEQGLLGSPQMQISGNGSSSYKLKWFSDRVNDVFPQATVISVPVYVYRLIMLIWSIWLAFAVIKWAQWGWTAFSHKEYWKVLPKKIKYQKKTRVTKKPVKDELFIDEDDISI